MKKLLLNQRKLIKKEDLIKLILSILAKISDWKIRGSGTNICPSGYSFYPGWLESVESWHCQEALSAYNAYKIIPEL